MGRSGLACLGLALWCGAASAAGFTRMVSDTDPPVAIGVWYPSAEAAPAEPDTPFRQALALDGPVLGAGLPLIVISHGDGGWMGGHAHTALALAQAGHVVAAPEHPGNNSEDEGATPAEWLVSRPHDVSTVIDRLLSDPRFSGRIDAGRIGVFGFSAGGYTALVAAGARPDIALAAAHCAARPEEFVCRIGLLDGVDAAALSRGLADAADPRIRAVSVAAPGLGFAFDASGLAGVAAPVQVWSGALDDRVPHATNGAVVAAGLPVSAEAHVAEGAGHFAFMAPCNPRLETANPRIWAMVCVDAPGFDRLAFHAALNARIVAFFDRALAD